MQRCKGGIRHWLRVACPAAVCVWAGSAGGENRCMSAATGLNSTGFGAARPRQPVLHLSLSQECTLLQKVVEGFEQQAVP